MRSMSWPAATELVNSVATEYATGPMLMWEQDGYLKSKKKPILSVEAASFQAH